MFNKLTKTIFAASTAMAVIATGASAENWRAWNVHTEGHPNYAAVSYTHLTLPTIYSV